MVAIVICSFATPQFRSALQYTFFIALPFVNEGEDTGLAIIRFWKEGGMGHTHASVHHQLCLTAAVTQGLSEKLCTGPASQDSPRQTNNRQHHVLGTGTHTREGDVAGYSAHRVRSFIPQVFSC